jgi:hypothetical protein
MVKAPTKELTPARRELAQWSAIIGTWVPAYLIFFMDWTPALTVSALGLGTAWVLLYTTPQGLDLGCSVPWRDGLGFELSDIGVNASKVTTV